MKKLLILIALLPSLAFAQKVKVIGFDINEERVKMMQNNIDPSQELVAKDFEGCDITFTDSLEVLRQAQFYIVAVPTPIDEHAQPDLKPLLGEPMQPADVVAHAPVTPGARVTGVTPFTVGDPPAAIGLRVDLSDGSALVVLPTTEEDIEAEPEGTTLHELADWEVRTPQGTLQVGPGLKWHFAPPASANPPDAKTGP